MNILKYVDKNLEKHLVKLEIIRDRLSWYSSGVNNDAPNAIMWKNIMMKRERDTMNGFKAALRKAIRKNHGTHPIVIKISNKTVQDLSSKLRINREMCEKTKQINEIKRELLETSAKICMNPTRIMRLLEENVISLDNIDTLYDL
jgi:hypothetical protein